MNKVINKYLQAMDFFVSFELDESFSESIKSRHRDEFSYASFSEGEKQRIDLALLFAWRSIAKMKNSTNTNLLILDEVFDSSLDTNGADLLYQILGAVDQNSNVFVISHRDALYDKFRSVIKFQKINNFSQIVR
jgi:DNA repair exonuclease SbcCD ATPase subunit